MTADPVAGAPARTSPVAPAQPVEPRPAATVMLLRDHGGLEVLLLRRSGATPFVPGAHVFPGGRVEERDHLDDTLVRGLGAGEADTILGRDRGFAFWVAAARECLEEANVLLAADAAGRPIDRDHPALADVVTLRAQIEAGTVGLDEVLRAHDLHLPLGRVAYVARWITPAFSPRRYDTRFFAAAMPPGQDVAADGWEAVDATWHRPTEALADWQAGRIELIEPTVASLALLERFVTTDEALDHLGRAARRPDRVDEPTGGVRVALDDEIGHR